MGRVPVQNTIPIRITNNRKSNIQTTNTLNADFKQSPRKHGRRNASETLR